MLVESESSEQSVMNPSPADHVKKSIMDFLTSCKKLNRLVYKMMGQSWTQKKACCLISLFFALKGQISSLVRSYPFNKYVS